MYRSVTIKTKTDDEVKFYPPLEDYSLQEKEIIRTYKNMNKRMEEEKKILARFTVYEDVGKKKITVTYYKDEEAYRERMFGPEMIALNQILGTHESTNMTVVEIKGPVKY